VRPFVDRFDREDLAATLRAIRKDKLSIPSVAMALRVNPNTLKDYLANVCGEETACPDDIIRPCIRLKPHPGFHDGGRT